MIGDEAAEANRLRLIEISDFFFQLNNNFQYLEGVVSDWAWFAKEGHPPKLSSRKKVGEYFLQAIAKLEQDVGVEFKAKLDLQKYLESEISSEWLAVLSVALPKLRSEIVTELQKALRSLRHLPKPLWADLLPGMFASEVLPAFSIGQYLSAVRRGCDLLRAAIRERTGLSQLDGLDLVNKAYGKDGLFAVSAWEGHSEENVRRGYTDMLRGAMAAIRNVHYHGTGEITELEAARLLVTLGMLWARVETTSAIQIANS